jgi:hypothetical protein
MDTDTEQLLEEVLNRLNVAKGPDGRGEYIVWCPFHPDGEGKPPHQANLSVSVRGFFCHACNTKGSLANLARLLDIDPGEKSAELEVAYNYRDEAGVLLYQVIRRPGKKFAQRRPDGAGGWIWNLDGVRRVLYRIPELMAKPDNAVFIVEGEKDADRLASMGLVATTNSGGAGKWLPEFASFLKARTVVILPDNDEPGRKHADQVAASLRGVASRVTVLALEGLPPKGDVSDWLDAGHSLEELKELAASARPTANTPIHPPVDAPTKPMRSSQAEQLLALVVDQDLELFHDQQGTAFARIILPRGRRITQLTSRDFSAWISWTAWNRTGKAVTQETIRTIVNNLQGRAKYQSPEIPLEVRVAKRDGAIWIDLDGDRAVMVTSSGWQIVPDPPIIFRPLPHATPFPCPDRSGSVEDLLALVNVTEGHHRILLACYLPCCFVPDIAIPALNIHGPQGSAKSTATRIIRQLSDPSAIPLQGLPRDDAALAHIAGNNRCLAFDNLQVLPGWLSDIVCRIITGTGWEKRALYTDDESIANTYKRVIMFNGINQIAQNADLLDRSVIIELEQVTPERRLGDDAVEQEFQRLAPRIFGGILDTLVTAMSLVDDLKFERLPRMADFGRWGSAISCALGYGQQAFLDAYDLNVHSQRDAAIEASPVAQTVLSFMHGKESWSGTSSDLLRELKAVATELEIDQRGSSWPNNPSVLSRRLKEAKPSIEATGLALDLCKRTSERRTVTITRATRAYRQPVNPSGVVTAMTDSDCTDQGAVTTQPIECTPNSCTGDGDDGILPLPERKENEEGAVTLASAYPLADIHFLDADRLAALRDLSSLLPNPDTWPPTIRKHWLELAEIFKTRGVYMNNKAQARSHILALWKMVEEERQVAVVDSKIS